MVAVLTAVALEVQADEPRAGEAVQGRYVQVKDEHLVAERR